VRRFHIADIGILTSLALTASNSTPLRASTAAGQSARRGFGGLSHPGIHRRLDHCHLIRSPGVVDAICPVMRINHPALADPNRRHQTSVHRPILSYHEHKSPSIPLGVSTNWGDQPSPGKPVIKPNHGSSSRGTMSGFPLLVSGSGICPSPGQNLEIGLGADQGTSVNPRSLSDSGFRLTAGPLGYRPLVDRTAGFRHCPTWGTGDSHLA